LKKPITMSYNIDIFNFKILEIYTSYIGASILIIGILLFTTSIAICFVNILLTEQVISPVPQAEEFIKWLDGLTPDQAIERLQAELDDIMKYPITNGDSDDSDKKADNSDKKADNSDKNTKGSDKKTV
jgi:hypothetical protein